MFDFLTALAITSLFVLMLFVGGWTHEKDLLRHCEEEKTMHAWTTDEEIYCEVKS